MGTKAKSRPKTTSTGKIDLSALDDEQFQTLLDLAQTALADPEVDEDGDEDLDEDVVEETSPLRRKRKKSKTKITVEKDSEEDGDEDDDEDEDEDDETDLSDADRVVDSDTRSQVRQMRLDLAEQRWQGERSEYLTAGVPPFLLDLAEPVLSQPDAMTIDLADDETINATETVRKMLDGVKGMIDLTGEIGHQVDLSDQIDKTDSADAFLKAWDEQYG